MHQSGIFPFIPLKLLIHFFLEFFGKDINHPLNIKAEYIVADFVLIMKTSKAFHCVIGSNKLITRLQQYLVAVETIQFLKFSNLMLPLVV